MWIHAHQSHGAGVVRLPTLLHKVNFDWVQIYGSIQRDKGLLICLVCLAAAGLVAAVKTMFGF